MTQPLPDATVAGIVFDVHRFALNDGPGIRTTVFLKGCPLRCLWCHNPESQAFEPQTAVDPERGGLRLIGARRTVAEVLAEVMADADYYARSGGGLTLSGGEPLAQFAFAAALLRAARAAGLHTCLDTCGYAGRSKLEAVLPYVDLFLYDYKATDPAEHEGLTGVSNERILANLHFLYHRGATIRLRCPLVPGVNDGPAHLQGIAGLAAQYPRLEAVELMPYHDMGRDKALHLGYANPLRHLPTTDDATKARWIEALHALGCTRARLG